MIEALKEIASATRREVKDFAKEHWYCGDPRDLGGYCAIASYLFSLVTKRLGYKVTFVEGVAFSKDVRAFRNGATHGQWGGNIKNSCNHCWVETFDHVIDITASQFNRRLNRSYIIQKNTKRYVETYFPHSKHTAAFSRLRKSWPQEQSPYEFHKELTQRANKLASQLTHLQA